MLVHALRLVEGEPIYAEPSGRFVSFAYTPLYPIVLRVLAPVAGVGYLPARAVPSPRSPWLSSSPTPSSGARAACRRPRRGRDSPAAFGPTGAWYDLARTTRCSSLTASAVAVGWWKRHTSAGLAAAALMTAAFFASRRRCRSRPLGLRCWPPASRRRALRATPPAGRRPSRLGPRRPGGWFLTYVFGLHRRHPFAVADAALVTPARLRCSSTRARAARRRVPAARRPTLYAAWIALTARRERAGGGTEWSYHNALIPASTGRSRGGGAGRRRPAAGDAPLPSW